MTEKQETVISIQHVSKQYTLGAIGGTTLRDELARKIAKMRGQEDPTAKIGQMTGKIGEKFWALKDVSFEVKKGEAIGIIGHNGAGKSTLLKLLCRVTAPTEGTIAYNGRIVSMLEVGTGFHGELTGRENVYMNGAILGMTKKEIAAKIDQIIEFSEIGQFIDTPVKRYSSGMYVKLAFSVAAHLDAEIMIMDEVLAVGDMNFQRKCISRMRELAKSGRTVLYVSHNLNTVRSLCDRCIVLNKGNVKYIGNVENAIALYMGFNQNRIRNHYDYPKEFHTANGCTDNFVIESLDMISENEIPYNKEDTLLVRVAISTKKDYKQIGFRHVFRTADGELVGTCFSEKEFDFRKGEKQIFQMEIDISQLMPAEYRIDMIAFEQNGYGGERVVDGVYPAAYIKIERFLNNQNKITWLNKYWGNVRLKNTIVRKN